MSSSARILVVAATDRELALAEGWRTLRCGVGPVEAAVHTTMAIAANKPDAILHVGVAGARRACGLAPMSVVVGTEARYCDLPSSLPVEWAAKSVHASLVLVEAACRVLEDATPMPVGTSARVGGAAGCDVEAMEGFGVLRAAQLAGVPAVEVRVISNEIEEENRKRWRLDEAFALITSITPQLVEEFVQCLS